MSAPEIPGKMANRFAFIYGKNNSSSIHCITAVIGIPALCTGQTQHPTTGTIAL